ncbi:MAG: molybdopterin-dependent oxidoreductase [Deltaproteobacteria bacterium]|nr:molybdopterin-dependent oxidoreductase [Deltaproteobacteria bacterium]
MKVDRRDFLKIIGLGTAGTAVSGCTLQGVGTALQVTEQEIRPPAGPESWVASTCGQCTGGCGILVRKIGQRAVKIDGNPAHPINRGGLCPLGQSGLQLLYSPDRIKQPMRRVGKRGEGKWETIGWNEAITLAASKLGEIRRKGEPQTLVLISGKERGLQSKLFQRFLEVYGSPNLIYTGPRDPMGVARALMEGMEDSTFDLGNTTHILNFGLNLLDGWWSPVRQMRAYADLRQGSLGRRGRLVQVESRLSVTAANADEWIPVNPGTEGVLALGLAHVLIREELYDKEFVNRYTLGFEDRVDEKGVWLAGFKSVVMEDYPPDIVAKITGVGVERILKVAREFASAERPLALFGGNASNTTYSAMAVHALNALGGNIGARGGVLFEAKASLRPWPAVVKDGIAQKGSAMPRLDEAKRNYSPLAQPGIKALVDAITTEKPYPVQALMIYGTNPLFTSLNRKKFGEALLKVPFLVSFSPFLDETAAFADLILPDHTYLEKWDDELGPRGLPFPCVGLRQPVVEPLYQTRHTGDVILELAGALEGEIARAFPWKEFKECLLDEFKGIYESGGGTIAEGELEATWVRYLEERGIRSPVARSFEEFWEKLRAKGSWWDPTYSPENGLRSFKTPSGKFEFFSPKTRRQFSFPVYEKPRISGEEKLYPFHLYLYPTLALLDGSGANQPFLQEIVGPHVNVQWNSWVEMNPETANRMGIGDGESVFVESPFGKVKTRAKLYPGTMPGVVSIPLGQGHTAFGRWAQGKGINPLDLIADDYDSVSGLPSLLSTRVKIYRA